MNVALHPSAASTARRILASPYARRLAREQELPLSEMRGSGPGGRVVALDIRSYKPALVIPADEPRPVIPALAAAVPLGGLGATANLAALLGLLAQFAAVGKEISIEDALLRAAAKALVSEPDDQIPGAGIVAFETVKGDQLLIGADKVSAMTQRDRRLAAEPVAPAETPAELSLWLAPTRGIRASFLPLRPGRALRLAVSLSEDEADLLLVFSTDTVAEARAAVLLAAIRDNLETGLGLFA